MITEILKKHIKQILLSSVVSALGGGATIWILRLITEYSKQIDDPNLAIAQFIGSILVMIVVNLSSNEILSRVGARIFFSVREELVERIAALSNQQLENVGKHKLYVVLTNDLNKIFIFFNHLPQLIYNIIVSVGCLVYMILISFPLFLILFIFILIAVVVAEFFFIRRGVRHSQSLRKIEDEVYDSYKSIIEGFKELQLNRVRKRDVLENKLQRISTRYRKERIWTNFFFNLAENWNSGILFFGIGALIFSAHLFFPAYRDSLSQFIIFTLYIVAPITEIVGSWQILGELRIISKILQDINLPGKLVQVDDKLAESAGEFQQISLHQAWYRYEQKESQNNFEMGPLDITIKRGEIVFLIGGNGSGKTTVAKLLAGFYLPSRGELRLNETVITEKNVRGFQNNFSVIFPDYYLFDRILNKHGLPTADSDIQRYLQKLKLDTKITIKDGILSTTKLSQGQRKRLALLVAYFDDSDIYIFDEWAAEQDPQFRDFFYNELLLEMKQKGKTIIVVTHDDRYFDVADRLIKFERGQMVADREEAGLEYALK